MCRTLFIALAAVQAYAATLTLSTSSNPAPFGHPVTLIANVTPAASTGAVTFYDGVAILGTRPLAGGKGALTTTLLSPGPHSLRAYYAGASSSLSLTATAQPVNTLVQKGTYTPFPASVSQADFNGDGITDLAVGTGTGVSVMLGNGDGTFRPPVTYSTSGYAYVAVGDFDGDGKIDLVASVNGLIFVFPGNGDGTFRVSGPTLNAQFGGALTVADFNGDGKADLAVNYPGIPILFGNGDGTFQPPIYGADNGATLSAVADFNSDGIPDLVTTNENGFIVLVGNGSGTFRPTATFAVDPPHESPANAAVGDFNGDGKLDLILVTAGYPAYSLPAYWNIDIYSGLGDGTFAARVPVVHSNDRDLSGPIAVTDFNGDGILDLAILSATETVTVMQGVGDGTFKQTFGAVTTNQSFPSSVLVCDLNGDGRTDLAIMGEFGVTALLGVQRQAPTTTLTSSSPAIAYGNNVTLTATISPASATGTITFSDGAAILVKVPLSDGQATFTTNLFNAGEHSLTAAYSGDTTFYTSTSPTLVQSIAPAAVTTALTSSANPASIAVSVLLAATVSPALATGTVTFFDGHTALATRVLVNGKSTLPLATLLPGFHFLKAFYNGDANVPPAASSILNQTITSPSPSQISLISSANPATLGQPLTLIAIFPGPGKITIYDGAQILSMQPTLTTSQLAAGTHSLRAYYSGDATHSPATSPALVQTIRPMPAPAFLPAIKTSLTASPDALALADFNGDGKTDFAVVDNRGVQVFLGTGDGKFAAPWTLSVVPAGIPASAAQIATNDFNGDGKPDLVVAYAHMDLRNITILLGNGDGTFQPAVSFSPVTSLSSLAVVDLNGDGRADIVAGAPESLYLLIGNGDGTFQPVSYPLPGLNPTALLADDFNADGVTDLAFIDAAQSTVDILLGAGNGTFRQPVAYTAGVRPKSLAIADFNQDGTPDLAVANDDGSVSVLFGKPGGTFAPAVTRPASVPGTSAATIAIGDWNADGKPDLALSHQSYVGILLGNGDGTFRELAYYSPGTPAIAVADFNGDGLTDLLAGGGILLGSSAAQAPASVVAIANAATSMLGSPVTQGSLAALIGSFPDPAAISVHAGVLNAPILSATSSKVVFQAPWQLSGGKTNVTVTANGHTTAPLIANLQTFAPGIFAISGETILQIYCTGLGPVTHQPATGVPASASPLSETELTITVGIGDKVVPPLFSGLVPGLIGVYQVNVQVPAGLPSNPSLPVNINYGNNGSNSVNIAVQNQ